MRNTLTKKSLSVILTLIMILSALPLTAVEGFAEATTSSDGLWMYSVSDGKATITANDTVKAYLGNDTIVTVPTEIDGYPVVALGGYAFFKCTDIKSITIPDCVISIEEYAFSLCESLESVTIPASVTNIAVDAFPYSGLTITVNYNRNCNYSTLFDNNINLIIPDSITGINDNEFDNWNGLTSVTIPESVTSIGESAFAGCNIRSITIPGSVKSIGENAFEYCLPLESVTINEGVESIGRYAFNTCYLTKGITIPDSVTNIDEDAFYWDIGNSHEMFIYCNENSYAQQYCEANGIPYFTGGISFSVEGGQANVTGCSDSLVNAVIPSEYKGYPVYDIKENAFENKASLVSIVFPEENLMRIGKRAFYGCASLESITIDTLSYYEIGESAFEGCTSLANVSLGDYVYQIDNSAFKNCNSLQNVTVGADNPFFYVDSGVLYAKEITDYVNDEFVYSDNLTLVLYPAAKRDESYIIPDEVTTLAENSFYNCLYLKHLVIPETVLTCVPALGEDLSVEDIELHYNYDADYAQEQYIFGGNYSFANKITSIIIPEGVTKIKAMTVVGDDLFEQIYMYQSLKRIHIPASVTEIEDGAFFALCSVEEITVDENNQFFTSYQGALFNKDKTKLINVPGSFETFSIPYGVKEIGSTAFYCNTSLKSVEIPNSVEIIDDGIGEILCAFAGCYLLESVTIPDSVTSIGWGAFYYCASLEDITIGNGVTHIGSGAFGDTAFYNNESNWEEGALYIDNCLLYIRTDINGTYTVKNGTRLIADGAFYSCGSLEGVIIPENVTNIGKDLFVDCDSFTNYYCYIDSEADNYAKNNNLSDKEHYIGDLDIDGDVDVSDYALEKAQLTTDESNLDSVGKTIADYNMDSAIDAFDLFLIDKKINNAGLTDFNYTVTSGNNAKITGYNASDVNVKIPARIDGYTITNIDNYAFKNNSSIKSVKISEGVKAINYGAFLNCTALETVELPNTITSIGTYAFKGCSSLTKITIPASVTSIQATSFTDCPNITIYGTAGSYAETYANNNSIPFVAT